MNDLQTTVTGPHKPPPTKWTGFPRCSEPWVNFSTLFSKETHTHIHTLCPPLSVETSLQPRQRQLDPNGGKQPCVTRISAPAGPPTHAWQGPADTAPEHAPHGPRSHTPGNSVLHFHVCVGCVLSTDRSEEFSPSAKTHLCFHTVQPEQRACQPATHSQLAKTPRAQSRGAQHKDNKFNVESEILHLHLEPSAHMF